MVWLLGAVTSALFAVEVAAVSWGGGPCEVVQAYMSILKYNGT